MVDSIQGAVSSFQNQMKSLQSEMNSLQHIKIPAINTKLLEPPRDFRLADYQYELIMENIKDFESGLDDEHEVALRLSSFGQSITLSVTDIRYANPSILIFDGYVGESPATLIQHVSQLNFLLLAAKKHDPEKPARRIGFALPIED